MELPEGHIETGVEGTQASATQAKETGLAEKEYDPKRKRRRKRFFEGVV